MGKFITGIRIERNSAPVDIPVEECEKIDDDGYIVRFQRAADVGIGERFLRFFSDLFDGVTKAKGFLCDPSREIPDRIFVKGKDICVTHRTGEEATGIWSEVSRNARTKEREINIEIILKPDAHADAKGHNAQVATPTPPSGKSTVVSIPLPPAVKPSPVAATAPTVVVTVPQALNATQTTQASPEARPKPPIPSRDTRPALGTQSTTTNAAATSQAPRDENIVPPPPAPPLPPADLLSRPGTQSAPLKRAPGMAIPANRQQEEQAKESTPIQTRGAAPEGPNAKMLQDASKKLRPVETRESGTRTSTQTSTVNQSPEGTALLNAINQRFKAVQSAPKNAVGNDSDNDNWDE